MSDWVEVEYEIAGSDKVKNGNMRKGYVNGTFGISEVHGIWVVTHLETGCKVDFLSQSSLFATKAVADKVGSEFDWSGDSVEEVAKNNGMEPKQMKKKIMEMVR